MILGEVQGLTGHLPGITLLRDACSLGAEQAGTRSIPLAVLSHTKPVG